MSETEDLRAEVEGLRRIIARSDAKADMWQIRAEAAEARVAELQGELTEADANAGELMARLRKVEAVADELQEISGLESPLTYEAITSASPAQRVTFEAADLIRAALAAEPTEVAPPAEQRAEGGA